MSPLAGVSPGVRPTQVSQSGLPGSCGLQQVETGVDVDSDSLSLNLRVLCGHGGQVEGTGGRVRLPRPRGGRGGFIRHKKKLSFF